MLKDKKVVLPDGVSVRDVNRAGVEPARQAAGDRLGVLGDMSSTSQLLEPYGTYRESQVKDAFREQAESLAQAGVDGFIIETMFNLPRRTSEPSASRLMLCNRRRADATIK